MSKYEKMRARKNNSTHYDMNEFTTTIQDLKPFTRYAYYIEPDYIFSDSIKSDVHYIKTAPFSTFYWIILILSGYLQCG